MIRIYFSKLKNGNLEITEKMLNDILSYMKRQDEEIEKLNKGYCPIKEKCNKGEYDCTNEEYNQMCEENIKLDLEIERLNKEIEYLTENDRKQVKWLKEEFNVGDDKK